MLLLRIGNPYINDTTLTIVLVMSCVILCASTPLRYQCLDGCVCLKDGKGATNFTSMTCDVDSVNLESGLLIPKVNALYLHCNGTLSDLDAINHMIRRLRYPDEVNTLALRECAVNEIKSETFANLSVLRVLEISGGNLTRFNPLLFANLTQLEQLVITRNLMLDLVEDHSLRFSDGGSEMAHNYSSNYTIARNSSIRKTTTDDMYSINITSLDLSMNGITKLATRFFNVFRNIEYLNLQDNNISNLTDISFFELRRLREIILDSNNITEIPDHVFRDLPNLNTISLSNNNIKNPVINFKGTESVQSLDLSYNLIDNLPDMFFQGLDSIENLNLTHNFITRISNMVSFAEFKMLKTIDLSHNRLTQIEDGYFVHLTKLERIDLSYNQIKRISSLCVDGVQNLQYLNLAFNQLTNFEQFPRLNTDNNSPVVDVIMEGNPLDCDCNMAVKLFDDFTGINLDIYPNWPNTNTFKNQRFVHWETLTCDKVHGWYNFLLGENDTMTIGGLISNYPLAGFFCDEDECPNECACYSLPAAKQLRNVVTQCYGVNLTDVPDNISNETNDLVLSLNRISHLQADTFPSMPYLTSLDMSGNHISFIDEQAFNSLCYIVSIDLNLNQITNITAGVFRPLHILNDLQLAGNQIEHIELGSFANNTRLQTLNLNQNKLRTLPAKFADQTILQQLMLFNNSLTTIPDSIGDLLYLAYLDLSYNMITNIPIGVFDQLLALHGIFLHNNNLTTLPNGVFANIISNLDFVTLGANPWSCSCLNQWFTKNVSAIVFGNITCAAANGDLAWPLKDTDTTKFECPGPPTHDHLKVVLSVSITLAILLVLVVVMAIVVYLNRITIRSVCLSRLGFYSRFPTPQPNENECKYDIYISYNGEDSAFVIDKLKPKLEGKDYKLYIRDIRAEIGGYIHQEITQCIEDSNSAIVIVSQNYLNSYLESDYGEFEFNHIIRQLYDKPLLALLVIQLEDLDPQIVNQELKQFVDKRGKQHKRCMKYPESTLLHALFWDKVFDQLPRPLNDLQPNNHDMSMNNINNN